MEFKDELDALGVKVDKLDKRVAVLEDGIGAVSYTHLDVYKRQQRRRLLRDILLSEACRF